MPEAPDGVARASARTRWAWEVWDGGADVGELVNAEVIQFEASGALSFLSQVEVEDGRRALVVTRAFAPRTWVSVRLRGRDGLAFPRPP